MEIHNAARIVIPDPDSQYRLLPCGCGSDQVVYVAGSDEKWRAKCLDCGKETDTFAIRHDVQVVWNRRVSREKS